MIFYLSCTGNTYWAAKTLAAATNERLVSIPEALNGDATFKLHDGERIGFCLPVHGWRVQTIVRRFLDKLHLVPAAKDAAVSDDSHLLRTYTYFLLTAGDSCGEYAEQLEHALAAKGLAADTCCSLLMPESYIGLPFMDVDTDLREAEKKMEARTTLMRFADILIDRRAVRMPIHRGAAPRFYSRCLGTLFHAWLVNDKWFKVDAARCTGCGTCVKHCPVGNMRMTDRQPAALPRPEWLHTGSCLTCMACYHHCPRHAIDFGRFTKNKGQYYFTHNHARNND